MRKIMIALAMVLALVFSGFNTAAFADDDIPAPEVPVETVEPSAEPTEIPELTPEPEVVPNETTAPENPTPNGLVETDRPKPGANKNGWEFTIYSPLVGQTFEGGYADIDINFSTWDDYDIHILGNGDSLVFKEWRVSYGTEWFQKSVKLPKGNYTLFVFGDYSYASDSVDFSVNEDIQTTIVRPDGSPAAPGIFYPTIKDGFKDKIDIRYRVNQRADVNVSVLNSTGTTVFKSGQKKVWPGEANSFEWAGNKNRGHNGIAKPGRYTVIVTAKNGNQSSSDKVKVYVKTDVVTKKFRDNWYGWWARTSHRGNCYASELGRHMVLDCWGGNYAQAKYAFKVPTNAHGFKFSVRGERGCCSNGRVIKTGNKHGDRYYVTVKATGWASYTVKQVNISYTAKVRR